jgi:hypothetical protein
MIRSNEKHVAFFLASLINLPNALIGFGNTNYGRLIDTGMSNHVRGSKVVHDELEFILRHTLTDLLCNTCSAHLWCLVISSNALIRRDKILLLISCFEGEDFFDTSIEEKRYMGVLFRFGNMNLVYSLSSKGLCENVTHVLRLERNCERIIELVLGHGGKGDVVWVRESLQWRTINIAKELSDFSNAVGTIIEEKHLIAICID